MDIKIVDSWLRDHLKTEAKPDDIARVLSLTSASIERLEPFGKKDTVYHIEVTTNRPDMASVIGFAREATAVLPRFEFPATFIPIQKYTPHFSKDNKQTIEIKNDNALVRRICCVILEVEIGKSPQFIADRLEASGTRSLNNLIDITNYVMHEMGHPTHAFDYDRLVTKKLIIRPSKKGEKITTLDKKTHVLHGGDIVADNGKGEIVDLLGVMGMENSVVTNTTKRILFFIDNNDPQSIRKTSMSLAIRTEAAGLNEKDIDPELAMPALLRGIELYQKYAGAKVISHIIDMYPRKPKTKIITVSKEKINTIVGIDIPIQQSITILKELGFGVQEHEETLAVTIPSWREKDMTIEEDIIEEIARVFGYHTIPSELPAFTIVTPYHLQSNIFYWEERIKQAMKYWGFTEIYTYSFVSEKLFDGPVAQAITLENPLDTDHIYLRKTLIPSLLEVVDENAGRENIKIFEIANVYHKKFHDLPDEIRTIAAVWKNADGSFYTMKGIVEQILRDLEITSVIFTENTRGKFGADIVVGKEYLGCIEILEDGMFAFEMNFDLLIKHATLKKTYTPIPKFPPIIEDIAIIIEAKVKTGDIIEEIKKQHTFITDVSLLDQFENTRTFHIVYQDKNKNLTSEDSTKIREKILSVLSHKFSAKVK